ncbi:MAG: hypothetical protein BWY52_00944 [Chloroflexi bacterium ADurb.Bin325]|nr:MAG: hypothetical protein BWY52_00944 [Chloroflexi bacterium ADurb.Bin325]
MAKAEINAGICGFHTTVIARQNEDGIIHLDITSECEWVRKLASQLQDVDPMKEAFWRRTSTPRIYELMPKCLAHPACPVPSGIVKAIEVEAGLALPADATIHVSRDNE